MGGRAWRPLFDGVMNENRPLYLRETVARDPGWWGANQPRLLAFHRRLQDALEERDERIARFAGVFDATAAADAADGEEEEEEAGEEEEEA